MKKLQNYFDIGEYKFSNKIFLILIFIAYIFSIIVRLYYYNWASAIPSFIWNGTLMINNVDGYYYAAGAKEILENSHVLGDLNPYKSFPSIVTAYIAKFLPFLSLDQVILWMPAFLSSLIVIPIMLIGRTFKNDLLGFFAALIASIAWSYYNRTLVGYYDTDMLIIVFLLLIFWSLINSILSSSIFYKILISIFMFVIELWYPQVSTILLLIGVITFFYIVIFDKKVENFLTLLIYFIMLSKYWYINFLLIFFIIYYEQKRNKFINFKTIIVLFIAVFIYLFFSGVFDLLITKLKAYVIRGVLTSSKLHFYTVMSTVSEASKIPYDLVAKRISGDVFLFFLSFIGYVMMLIRFPIMIISIPSVVLGLLAHKLGLRFTIYAVPFFALGFSYLAIFIARKITNKEKLVLFTSFSFILVSLIVNIIHVLNYKVPTTFISAEVRTLDMLSQKATPNDYVFTWWDYGYPIRYYAHMKTLADGGKHSGKVVFPISYAFMSNQKIAANIMRLDTEYTEKLEIARELRKKIEHTNFIQDMMEKYKYTNPYKFLEALNNYDFPLPKKTRNVYVYLPFRMIDILPTVFLFGSTDLLTGKVNRQFIISTRVVKASPEKIVFGSGIVLDSKGILHIYNQEIPINSLFIGYYKNKEYQVYKKTFYPKSNIFVLWYKPLNRVLIIDSKLLNSTFVQLFFFENYDKKLFTPVILNPYVKIYKLNK